MVCLHDLPSDETSTTGDCFPALGLRSREGVGIISLPLEQSQQSI